MTLAQIEAQILEEMGRNDLQGASGTDRGLRYYINRAQALLDLTVDHPRSKAPYHATLSSGDYYLHIPRAIIIYEVWIANGTIGRQRLRPMNLGELRAAEYRPIADQASGVPYRYSIDNIQIAPPLSDRVPVDYTGMYDYESLDFQSNYAAQGILFYPKALETYTIRVVGRFFHPDLADNIAAVGTITVDDLPVADETFTIDSQTFIWKVLRSGTGEVTIGATPAEQCTNIAAAVNADLTSVTAVAGSTTVTITAATAGRDGNSIVFANVDSTGLTFDESDEQAGYLGGTTRGQSLDTSFWTEVHPDSLVAATRYKLEEVSRNREGMNDALAALDLSLGAIGMQMTNQAITRGWIMREKF